MLMWVTQQTKRSSRPFSRLLYRRSSTLTASLSIEEWLTSTIHRHQMKKPRMTWSRTKNSMLAEAAGLRMVKRQTCFVECLNVGRTENRATKAKRTRTAKNLRPTSFPWTKTPPHRWKHLLSSLSVLMQRSIAGWNTHRPAIGAIGKTLTTTNLISATVTISTQAQTYTASSGCSKCFTRDLQKSRQTKRAYTKMSAVPRFLNPLTTWSWLIRRPLICSTMLALTQTITARSCECAKMLPRNELTSFTSRRLCVDFTCRMGGNSTALIRCLPPWLDLRGRYWLATTKTRAWTSSTFSIKIARRLRPPTKRSWRTESRWRSSRRMPTFTVLPM